jgi:tape measure domain-containing protein
VSVVANVAINVDSRNAVSKLREVQSQSQQTERAIDGLGAVVGRLAGAFAAFQAAKFVFVQAAEVESQRRSLEVLTGSAQRAGQIVKELQDLGAVTPFTSSELIDAAKRLQAFGVETNKVVDTTRRLADVSGATGAELQGLVTAYGQVQAKGRLQGEELLQFQERGVALQQVLREEYNLSGEEFQKALEGGRISAQAVEAAIIKLTDAGGKYANGAIAQSDTLNGKLSTLQDSFQRLAQNIGTFFAPVFKFLIDGVNALIERLNTAGRIGAEARAYEEANRRTRTRFGALRYVNPFDQEVQQYRERLRKSLVTAEMDAGRAAAAPVMTRGSGLPPLLGATGGKGRGGKSDAEKTAEKAAREAEKLRQELERSLEVGDQLGTQFSRQVLLLDEASETERKRLQIQFDFEDRAKQISELKNAEQRTNLVQLNGEIRRLEIIDLQTEALKKQAEEAEKLFKKALGETEFGVAGEGTVAGGLSDKIAKLKEDLSPIKLQIDTIVNGATAIGDAFSTAFGEVITGAKSTQEALADAFKSIGQAFISMALEIIAKQMTLIILQTIFNALSSAGGNALGTANKNLTGTGALKSPIPGLKVGGYAEGGFVTGPTNALIGEGGEPEYVIPASKMRSAMSRYSAGARGAAVIPGNGASGGGGTVGGGSGSIDVRYTVERINSVDYVTADQFQRGMAQAAKQGAEQGERRALSRLQNSPSVRRRVGV